MRAVVDTNVVAYYLLRTEPFVAEAAAFWSRIRQVHAPASWEAEVANVVWMATRAGLLDGKQGIERLRLARSLDVASVPVAELWEGALVRAVASDHPVYDTLFVELAVRLGCPLATFDRGLLEKFGPTARRPAEVVRPRRRATARRGDPPG